MFHRSGIDRDKENIDLNIPGKKEKTWTQSVENPLRSTENTVKSQRKRMWRDGCYGKQVEKSSLSWAASSVPLAPVNGLMRIKMSEGVCG